METISTLTCPNCGAKETNEMPTDYCQHVWVCPTCSTRVTPKQGDCCVYCSYGTFKCPSIQESEAQT